MLATAHREYLLSFFLISAKQYSNDSVECAVCHNTYHMNCVRPPLLKKPSRGFAWACGPCSRAQEKKLEARRTPLIGTTNEDGEEEEIIDEEEEEVGSDNSATPDPDSQVDLHPGTQAEIALAKMWPMRYLGIHCRVEDALQYDDRAIYPRASSRLGPRHQANVNVWHGQPVEFVKPAEIKKRYVKSTNNKVQGKLTKETVAAIEADKAEKAKRPKWVMDEPVGYVRRGEDLPNKDSKCTAELIFKMPPLGVHSTRGEDNAPTVTEEQVKAYMERAKKLASHVGVESYNTNFLTKALALFTKHQYDADAALKQVKKLDKRKDLKEPELTKEEEKKWNEGVAKYGSEIRNVRLHTSKTMFYGDAVRYYYMWKKTPKGKEIWGSYSNRKGRSKKIEPDAQSRLLDDVADEKDDSAFDNEKAVQRKRNFQCKFCTVRHSRQWRRAPGVSPGQMIPADGRSKDKSGFVVALCLRCANLWRKYAVKWENVDEIAKKVAQGGGKAWKRRIDEELLREVYAAQADPTPAVAAPEYLDLPAAAAQAVGEPAKKKQKTGAVGNGDSGTSTPNNEPAAAKKKEKEKPAPPPKAPTPPPVPAQPRLRALPCAVCRTSDGTRLECAACRLTVHKACYGVEDVRQANKWYCDTCRNDKKESVSYVSLLRGQSILELTITRLTSASCVRTKSQNRTSMSSPKSHTRRRATETERRSVWRKNSLTLPKKITASDSKRKAAPSFLASHLSVPQTTTGYMYIVRSGTRRSSSATPTASIWLRALAQAPFDTTRSASFARPAMVLVCRACSATRTSTLAVRMIEAILSDSTLHLSRPPEEMQYLQSLSTETQARWLQPSGARSIHPRHPSTPSPKRWKARTS